MTALSYMIGPGVSFFRSEGDIDITFNTTRPKVVDIGLQLYDIIIPILGVLVIIINGAIVISSGLILYRGQQPRATYLFLGNVAIADLLTGVAVLLGMFYPRAKRTETVCASEIGMTVSASLASVYSIGLIAVDRYLYILYGLRYQRYIYPNRARCMILAVWSLALTVGFLPAMGYRHDTNNGQLCWFIIIEPPELILATTTIGMIPLVVIIILYSIILYHALKKISQIKTAANNNQGVYAGNLRMFRGRGNTAPTAISRNLHQTVNDHLDSEEISSKGCWALCKRKSEKAHTKSSVYNPSKWKAIKIVALTTGCYFISWFPYFLTSALYAVCNPSRTPFYCNGLRVALASPLAILGLSNSLMNPVIYAWWHNGFRETLRKICKNYFYRDRILRGTESPTITSQSTVRTRSSGLSKSNPETEAEVGTSDQEDNPMMTSRVPDNEKILKMVVQNLKYENGAEEQMVTRQDIERQKLTVVCTSV